MKRKNDPENLMDKTFKKVNTVGELKKWLDLLNDDEPIFMFSDEEGNRTNKVLYLELYTEGLFLIPWEE